MRCLLTFRLFLLRLKYCSFVNISSRHAGHCSQKFKSPDAIFGRHWRPLNLSPVMFIFYTVVKVYIVYKILFTLITSCFLDIFCCCQMLVFCLTKSYEHLSTGTIHNRRAGILLPVWNGFTL